MGLAHNNSPTAPRMVRARKRELEIFDLRAQGKTYRQIADALNVDVNTVINGLKRVVKDVQDFRQELGKEYVATQLERLRMATEAIIGRVQEGDLDAIETMLKIETRVSRLLALDAPVKWPTDEYGRSMAPGAVTVDFDTLSDTQLESLRLLGLGEAKIEEVQDDDT
jgi:hypothetical protein